MALAGLADFGGIANCFGWNGGVLHAEFLAHADGGGATEGEEEHGGEGGAGRAETGGDSGAVVVAEDPVGPCAGGERSFVGFYE